MGHCFNVWFSITFSKNERKQNGSGEKKKGEWKTRQTHDMLVWITIRQTIGPSVRFAASLRCTAFVAPFPPVLGIWPKFPSASPVPPGGGGEGSLSTAAGWCSAYIPPWQGSRASIDPWLPCQAQVRLLPLLGAHWLFGRVGVPGLRFQVLLQLVRNRAIGTGWGVHRVV